MFWAWFLPGFCRRLRLALHLPHEPFGSPRERAIMELLDISNFASRALECLRSDSGCWRTVLNGGCRGHLTDCGVRDKAEEAKGNLTPCGVRER